MIKKKKIAILITSLCGGGAERVVVNLANNFIKRGYAVDMVLLSNKEEILDDLVPDVNVIYLNIKRIRGLLLPLIRYLRRNRPHTLLANMWPITSMALVACKMAFVSTRLVIVEHTTWSKCEICHSKIKTFLVKSIMRCTFPFADKLVTVSKGAADDLALFANLRRTDIKVIYNPIVGDKNEASTTEVVNVASWSDCRYKFLAVGALKPVKDFTTLLNAFSMISRSIDAKLLILGEGECRDQLELQIKKLGIQDRVFMPGFVGNTKFYYSQADLFVLTSRVEGFGNVVVESLAAGTPVVSTDCPSGPREILSNGKFGMLVPVGDVKALADAMLKSLHSEHKIDQLIARAHNFSIEKSVDQYIQVIFGK